MKQLIGSAVLCAAVFACHNDIDHPGGKLIDAPPRPIDAEHHGPDAAPIQHTVTASPYGDAPVVLQYYTASTGQWHTPDAGGNGYVLDVAATDTYELVAVCVDGTTNNSQLVEVAQAYPADGTQFYYGCYGNQHPSTVEVTGTMEQAGTLWIDGYDTLAGTPDASSATGPWNFDVHVAPLSTDLMATGSNAMVIRRNDTISANETEPTIDLSVEGVPYAQTPLTISNQGSDAVGTETIMYSAGGGYTAIVTATATANSPANAQLESGDYVAISALAISASSSPGTLRSAGGAMGTTTLPLPDPWTGVAFADDNGATKATFTALPASATYAVMNLGNATAIEQVEVSAAWITATSATSLEVAAVPGLDAAWQVTPANATFTELEADTVAAFGTQVTSVFYGQPLDVPTPAAGTGPRTRVRAGLRPATVLLASGHHPVRGQH